MIRVKRAFCSAAVPPVSRLRLFLRNCNRHKYKLLFLGLAGASPFVYDHFKPDRLALEKQAADQLQKTLHKDSDVVKLVQAFLIQTIIDVLKSPEVMSSGIGFTLDLVNNPKVNEELLKFLLAGLKDPVFLDQLKVLGRDLTIDVLKDPTVQQDLIKLLLVAAADPENYPRPGDPVRAHRSGEGHRLAAGHGQGPGGRAGAGLPKPRLPERHVQPARRVLP